MNLPFGFWRAGARRFTLPWFLAVHAPVPLVVGVRALAGLGWRLTTVANDRVRPLHLRMPVILPPADCEVWLDPSVQEAERLQSLLRPYPAEAMEAYPVGTRVNNHASCRGRWVIGRGC
jgi:hypothetical protein